MEESVTLESSAISTVTYDVETKMLEVEFREGGTYRYLNVPITTYRALLKAESAGAFWNEVKNDFAFVKVR